MSDELAKLQPDQVAGFYKRLADQVDRNKGGLQASLSATLMRHWLANRNPQSTFFFDPPEHLTSHPKVIEVLIPSCRTK